MCLRLSVIQNGGLEPLLLGIVSPSVEVQIQASAALANLAISEDNKVIHFFSFRVCEIRKYR